MKPTPIAEQVAALETELAAVKDILGGIFATVRFPPNVTALTDTPEKAVPKLLAFFDRQITRYAKVRS